MNKPSALLAADYHLRDSQPLCRGDDFISAMISTSKFISDICEEHKIPLLIAGDIFDHWKPSPRLLSLAIEYMPKFIAIPGQHDLPEHNLLLHHKSGLAVLEAAGVAIVLNNPRGEIYLPEKEWADQSNWMVVGFPYGSKPALLGNIKRRYPSRRKVCMIHQLISHIVHPFPGADAPTARGILGDLKGYDFILSGDNHQQFTLSHRSQLLVNPGSIFRTKADQIDHTPAVYLWSAEDNSFEKILLPVENDIITRDHLDQQEEKDQRIDDYIERMKSDYEIELSFENNMREHIRLNHKTIDKELTNFIFSCMEVEK